jgi:hypothetical protein
VGWPEVDNPEAAKRIEHQTLLAVNLGAMLALQRESKPGPGILTRG